MSWYLKGLKKYAIFSGRARRKEYWMFFLVYALIMVGLACVEMAVSGNPKDPKMTFTTIFVLAHILPLMAVGFRRLHDTGKSGWWYLLFFVPLIGGIIFIVLMVQEGEQGDNRFGPDPRLVATN